MSNLKSLAILFQTNGEIENTIGCRYCHKGMCTATPDEIVAVENAIIESHIMGSWPPPDYMEQV